MSPGDKGKMMNFNYQGFQVTLTLVCYEKVLHISFCFDHSVTSYTHPHSGFELTVCFGASTSANCNYYIVRNDECYILQLEILYIVPFQQKFLAHINCHNTFCLVPENFQVNMKLRTMEAFFAQFTILHFHDDCNEDSMLTWGMVQGFLRLISAYLFP